MKKLLIALVVLLAGGVVYYLASPLFFDVEVDEQYPSVSEQLPLNLEEQVPAEMKKEHDAIMAEVEGVEAVVDDPMPGVFVLTKTKEDAGPKVVAQGEFVGVAHKGAGTALILSGAGSNEILRLEDLMVDNGPDLRVLLSKNADVRSSGDLGSYVELAKLKGNIGNQNYTIPTDINVEDYKSVIIYCKPFKVVFNSANLK